MKFGNSGMSTINRGNGTSDISEYLKLLKLKMAHHLSVAPLMQEIVKQAVPVIREILLQDFMKSGRLPPSGCSINIEENAMPPSAEGIPLLANASNDSTDQSVSLSSPESCFRRSSSSLNKSGTTCSENGIIDEAEESLGRKSKSRNSDRSVASRQNLKDNEPFELDTGVSLPAGKVRAMSHYRKDGNWTGLIRELMFELNGGKDEMRNMTVKGQLEDTKGKRGIPIAYYKAVFGE